MRNGALLVLLSGTAVANGLFLDAIPLWRQVTFVALVAAAYLHGRYLPVRRGWVLIAISALPAAAPAPWNVTTAIGAVLVLAVFMVLPWLAGRFQHQQAAQLAHLVHEQEFIRLRERSRISADMHDSLGHDLALIALRAGALEVTPDLPEATREAATQLRESAVAATDRLRATLHLLREPGASHWPASLTALIARAQEAGLRVDFTGPDSADPTVHRVAQEALTNASRHAPGAPVTMTLTQHATHTTLTIKNLSSRTPPARHQGTGLPGLNERVTLLGGTFTAAHADGTFTVTAHIPTPAEA